MKKLVWLVVIAGGLLLVLPESIWANPRSSNLSPSASARLEPLAALLANNADYQIVIETFTDNRGSEIALQQLTQDRARVLSERFAAGDLEDHIVRHQRQHRCGIANLAGLHPSGDKFANGAFVVGHAASLRCNMEIT